MTTALSIRPNVLKKDFGGNWYAIPEKEVNAFIQASEAVELTEFMSDEWSSAIDDLNNSFSSYRKDV